MNKEIKFFEKVYAIVKLIPYGKVTSYGAIAKYIGAVRSARMVGWAMNQSHDKNIPAHRVVNRVGLLSGKHHFDGIHLMQKLLEAEGIPIQNHQVQNFEQYFWDPSEQLEDF